MSPLSATAPGLARLALLVAVFCAAACTRDNKPPPFYPLRPATRVEGFLRARSAGSIALSADDRTVYVAEEDTGTLLLVDADRLRLKSLVAFGPVAPSQLVVADDGFVWVTFRRGRAVAVVDPDPANPKVVATIAVAEEPSGIALTPDGRKALVATRTGATLEVLDVATRTREASIPIPFDATRVAAPTAGRAFVFHARSGLVSVVDLAAGKVDHALSLTEAPAPGQETRHAGMPAVPSLLPGTTTLFVPVQLTKSDPVPTNVPDAYLGGDLRVPAVGYGLVRIDVSKEELLSAEGTCFGCGNTDENGGDAAVARVPAALQHARVNPIAGPAVAVTDGAGKYLFVANHLSANVSAFPTFSDTHDVFPVPVGSGPSGLAVASTDDVLYAYASFDHRLSRIVARRGLLPGEQPTPENSSPESVLRVDDAAELIGDPLAKAESNGRKLFHAADDRRMTNPRTGGIACASCHPDGRDDGGVWQFTEGPRNTPSLIGRKLGQTGPYHWDGLLKTPFSFSRIVVSRMGGVDATDPNAHGLKESDFDDIFAWLDSLPPLAHPAPVDPDAAERGRLLFEGKADCASCHPAPLFTDNAFHDVGTSVAHNPFPGGNPDTFPDGINTPTLLGIWATAPYLHDGSVPTLRERLLRNPGDRHGHTSTLTPAELDDLEAYLQSL